MEKKQIKSSIIKKLTISLSYKESGFTDGRSPVSEQIELTVA